MPPKKKTTGGKPAKVVVEAPYTLSVPVVEEVWMPKIVELLRSARFSRSSVVCGVNAASRALELRRARLLVVATLEMPQVLVTQLAAASLLAGVPFYALPRSSEALGELLALSRTAALAVVDGDFASSFPPAPTVDAPWLSRLASSSSPAMLQPPVLVAPSCRKVYPKRLVPPPSD